MAAEFTLPTSVVFGEGCRMLAGQRARALGGTRALLVTDPGVWGAGLVDDIVAALEGAGLAMVLFDEVQPNPRVSSVVAARELALSEGCDVVVAVGGGSPIDTAKAAALLLTNGGEVADYDFTLDKPRPIEHPPTPLLAVPTTAGTGSEVTFWAVITDPRRHEKLGLGGPPLAPRVALVDSELTLSLPPQMTAFAGLDALTHAIEAFAASNAGPLSDLCALRAIALVAASLRRATADGGDRAARRDMILASLLAGAAFTNADVGAVHCIAEVVGGLYDLPHGLACALYLPAVTEFSAAHATARYAEVAAVLGIPAGNRTAEAAPAALVSALATLTDELGVPRPGEAGVRFEDHARIARRCAATINGYAVPRAFTEADFLEVLADADS